MEINPKAIIRVQLFNLEWVPAPFIKVPAPFIKVPAPFTVFSAVAIFFVWKPVSYFSFICWFVPSSAAQVFWRNSAVGNLSAELQTAKFCWRQPV